MPVESLPDIRHRIPHLVFFYAPAFKSGNRIPRVPVLKIEIPEIQSFIRSSVNVICSVAPADAKIWEGFPSGQRTNTFSNQVNGIMSLLQLARLLCRQSPPVFALPSQREAGCPTQAHAEAERTTATSFLIVCSSFSFFFFFFCYVLGLFRSSHPD